MVGPAAQTHLTGAGLVEAHDDLGERGLAAARGTDQRHALALGHAEAHIIDRPQGLVRPEQRPAMTIVATDPVDLEQWRSRRRSLLLGHVKARSGDQLAGIFLLRLGKDGSGVATFHQHPLVHHRHPLAQRRDRLEIVADEQQRHLAPFAQLGNQIEHGALGDQVQRRCGLVGDQQFGLPCQRHGNHHALALSARELMGEPRTMFGLKAHFSQQLRHRIGRRIAAIELDGFTDLPAHLHQRIERRHRLLKHHADALAAQPRHVALIVGQGLAVEPDAAAHQRTFRLQPGQRQRRHGLARAAFPDDAEAFPALERKADVAYRRILGKAHRQIGNFKQGHWHFPAAVAGRWHRAAHPRRG